FSIDELYHDTYRIHTLDIGVVKSFDADRRVDVEYHAETFYRADSPRFILLYDFKFVFQCNFGILIGKFHHFLLLSPLWLHYFNRQIFIYDFPGQTACYMRLFGKQLGFQVIELCNVAVDFLLDLILDWKRFRFLLNQIAVPDKKYGNCHPSLGYTESETVARRHI